MRMRAFYGNIKHLPAEDIGGTDASGNHSRACTVDPRIRSLRTPQTEFHNAVPVGCVDDAGGLGGDQALMVDDI